MQARDPLSKMGEPETPLPTKRLICAQPQISAGPSLGPQIQPGPKDPRRTLTLPRSFHAQGNHPQPFLTSSRERENKPAKKRMFTQKDEESLTHFRERKSRCTTAR